MKTPESVALCGSQMMFGSDRYEQLCRIISRCVGEVTEAEAGEPATASGQCTGPLTEEIAALLAQALHSDSTDEHWLYFRVPVLPSEANYTVIHRIEPVVRRFAGRFQIKGWWWLNKVDACGPAVRLRVGVRPAEKRECSCALLAGLREVSPNTAVLKYEPELCLFGGPVGIRMAHMQFCAESDFLIRFVGPNVPGSQLLPEGLSVAILLQIIGAAHLDLFEAWDVFHRVAKKRRTGQAAFTCPQPFRRTLQTILEVRPDKVFGLYGESPAREALLAYAQFAETFGTRLNQIWASGQLECGLREFLAPLVLFHWNRVGLPHSRQALVSHWIADELRCLTRNGAANTS